MRHLFGKQSFDPKETFDTLIECERCLPLEDTVTSGALMKEIEELTATVTGMKDDIGMCVT